MRFPPQSPTYTLDVTASKDTPIGYVNIAETPSPSAQPEVPLPASVLTFQTQSGCALNPATGHAVAGEQGEHAAAPFEKLPVGQLVAVKGHDDIPCALYAPAAQGRQDEDEAAPLETE